jgi:hypothetical protein
MSDAEKNQLTSNGTVIWISLEKNTTNRHAAMKQLLDHVEKNANKRCGKIITSASSFLVAIYDTTSDRDKDMKRLAKVDFKFKDKLLPVQLAKFGDAGNSSPYVFVIDAGCLANASDISVAINAKIKENGDSAIPAYEIRELLRTNSKRGTGVFVTIFSTPVKGLGKSLEVGPKKVQTTITKEGGKCLLCHKKSHRTLKCDSKEAPFALSNVQRVQQSKSLEMARTNSERSTSTSSNVSYACRVCAWLNSVPLTRVRQQKKPAPVSGSKSEKKTHSVAIPRISKIDKERIEQDNRALFVPLPKSVTSKRATIMF